MKRLQILGLILVLSLTSCGSVAQVEQEDRLSITTSFYPIYLLAKEITADVEGVALSNMAQPQSGCLHDYTLSTKDMNVLAESNVLLLNGGGMEHFLEDAIETFPELMVVDTSVGISLLSETHDHDSEEEQGEEEPHGGNAHLWLSPETCMQQVTNMVEAISMLVPKERLKIEENGAKLLKEMEQLTFVGEGEVEEIPVAIFHEGFAYFDSWAGLHPSIEIFVEEYETPTPQVLAEAVEIAKAEGIHWFLAADDAGLPYAKMLAEECGGSVMVFDPLTMGDLTTGHYIEAMRENLKLISYLRALEAEK